LLIIYVSNLIANHFKYRLNSIPGPFVNSVSVLPRLWSVAKGSSHLDDYEHHKKYGKIVRLSPTTVSVVDLGLFEAIYGISSKFHKAGFYEPVRFYDEEGLIPDPFVLSDKATHTRMKRSAANAYSLQALIQLEPLLDVVLDGLLTHLDKEYAGKGKLCDLGSYMLYFAVDAIFTVTFGKNLDFTRKGDTKQLCEQIRQGLPYISCIGQIPWAHRFLLGNPLLAKFFQGGGDSFAGKVMEIAIEQREAAEKEIGLEDSETAPCTFLLRLLRNKAKNPGSITDREVNSHTFGNILAGGDTTSTAVKATLYYLIRNPRAMERLLAELRKAGLDRGSPVVPYAAASQVAFLTAVIREAMRLHPSVGMILARGVPHGGVTFVSESGEKYSIGAGAEIGFNPWIMHRDPEVFPDPEMFIPERWIDSEPDHLIRMNRAWIAFGAGRHSCSGQHVSMLEMTKLIASLVLRYDMRWGIGQPDISVENYFFTMQTGLKVMLERR
ncbi:cytochrome P450 oxidoreductase, partial [Coniochaeta sp. PMI_546]